MSQGSRRRAGFWLAGRFSPRQVDWMVLAAAAAVLVVAFGIVLATGSTSALGHLGGPAFGFGVVWVLGDRTRNRRAYLAQLEERAARLERERAEHARRAAEAERIGIARELHDVVVHNVSVIAVQAGAARATSHLDPDRATAALGLIERTARTTLTELRALLGVLRRQDRSAPVLAPQPSLAQLDRLLGQTREAGVRVDARVQGQVRPLPATADLAAYRIVQEALTNVVKHAPGANVVLTLGYRPGDLQIVVDDDGPGTPTPSGGSGTPASAGGWGASA
jgi:signal transduction histidine kinase